MKTESFKAGYAFVRGVRALAYTGMTAGILTSIGLAGYHIYDASSALSKHCDNDNALLAAITDVRDKDEAAIAKTLAEDEAAIAKTLAEDEANIAEARARHESLVASLPEEEAAYRAQHQSNVDRLNNSLKAATDALNAAANEAEQEVKKVSPLSADYDFPELQFESLTSAGECEAFLGRVAQSQGDVEDLQNELYKSILTKLEDIKKPIQDKKAELENEISNHQGDISRWEADIEKIKDKYTIEQKIVTYQQIGGKYLNKSVVFTHNSSDQNLRGLGNSLPVVTTSFTSGGMIQESDVQEFRKSVARLSAWLPVFREGTGEEKTGERVESKKNPYPKFTEEDKNSIEELNTRIAERESTIRKIKSEQIAPLDYQLTKVDGMINTIENTKTTVLANWKVADKVEPISTTCDELKSAFEKFDTELPAMQANHRQQILSAEQAITNAVERKQKNLDDGTARKDNNWKQGNEAKDKRWAMNCAMREAAWEIGCKGISGNFLLKLIFDGMLLVGSWISWAATLILMDFVVSTLVIALRTQEIQKLMEKKAETDSSK